MSKLPVVSAQTLIKVLKKKGFVLVRVHGSHHILAQKKDRLMVSVPVHKGKDLGKGITMAILKDANISIEDFLKLLKK